MLDFLRKNKLHILKFGILVILTILLCITVTRSALIGVFGYLAYFYLALGYVGAILSVLGKSIDLPAKKWILYISTAICLAITVHIFVCGKEMVNGGFSHYVASAYRYPTVGGVALSIVSMPIVLPCKFIVSGILFFVATALLGLKILWPLVAVNKGGKTRIKPKRPLFNEKERSPETQGLYVEELPKKIFTEPINTVTKVKETPTPKPEPTPVAKPLTSAQILFGDNFTPKTHKPAPIDDWDKEVCERKSLFDQPKTDYTIVDGYDANFIKPNLAPYTNNYLEQQEAAKVLFNRNLQEEYNDLAERKKAEAERKNLEEETKRMSYTPFVPTEVLFDSEEVEEDPTPTLFPDDELSDPLFAETTADNDDYTDKGTIDTPFAQALRSNSTNNAPPPIKQSFTPTQKSEIKPPKPEEELVPAPVIKVKAPYKRPPLDLLVNHVTKGYTSFVENYAEMKEVFEEKLKHLGVDLRLVEAIKGPTITKYILELSETCPINKVINIKRDIGRLLKAKGEINIITQIAGSPYMAIEVPNTLAGVVSFKEILSSQQYAEATGELNLALGKTADGRILIDNLASMPHALVAGSTGSGKSVCINTIICSLISRYSPDEVKLILIDLKLVEMALYSNLPHMIFREPLSEIPQIINALKWARLETEQRFVKFKKILVRNLDEYNAKVAQTEKMARIVIIIDEASELMSDPNARKTVESTLSSLARVARAAGVHLIFATQNPSKDVITNEIQNNLNTKIAFAVGEWTHSMVIFKAKGAETLLGKGDMLIKKGSNMLRAQGAFISTAEVENLADYIRNNNDCDFDNTFIDKVLNGKFEEKPPVKTAEIEIDKDDIREENMQDLIKSALKVCIDANRVSTTFVQRKLNKGYVTTANIMDRLEQLGYVSPQVNNKRNLLITREDYEKLYGEEEEI